MKWKLEKFISVTLLMSLVLSAMSPPALAVYATAPQVGNETEKETVRTEESAVMTEEGLLSEPETESAKEVLTEVGETEQETESKLSLEETGQPQETVEQSEPQMPEKETAEVPDDTPDTEGETFGEKEEGTEQLKEETEEALQREPDTDISDKQDLDMESNNEETQLTEPVQVALTRELMEPSEETPDPEAAGAIQNLKIDAFNPMQEDVKLQIYFWDYHGSETDGKNIPEELLTEACDEVTFPTCNEDQSFPVTLMAQDGSTGNASAYLCETREAEKLTARYIEADIPKGSMLTGTFPLVNDQAETVVVSVAVSPENQTDTFDKCVIGWKEKEAKETQQNTEPSSETEKSR